MEEKLRKRIDELRELIKLYSDKYERNEQMVRSQLIEQVLEEIGWNPRDPGQVIHNQKDESGIPDYTLLKEDGTIALYLEAKNLSTDLTAWTEQLGKYIFNRGVELGVLTNGAEWLLFEAYRPNTHWSDRTIWKIGVRTEYPSMRDLLMISRDNLPNWHRIRQFADAVDEAWETIVRDSTKLAETIIPAIKTEMLKSSEKEFGFDTDRIRKYILPRVERLIRAPEPPLGLAESSRSPAPMPSGSIRSGKVL